jgi:two-component system chemotaxis response regulator CheY
VIRSFPAFPIQFLFPDSWLPNSNRLTWHSRKEPEVWHGSFCKKGMRVLIADDQKSVGATLADLVTHCNHEVVEVVESGFDAIQAYTRHHPDVVVMDYWMSKLNGATACRNILARDPGARIILVSGWSPITDLTESGAVAILSKPVELNSLVEALNTAAQAVTPPFDW